MLNRSPSHSSRPSRHRPRLSKTEQGWPKAGLAPVAFTCQDSGIELDIKSVRQKNDRPCAAEPLGHRGIQHGGPQRGRRRRPRDEWRVPARRLVRHRRLERGSSHNSLCSSAADRSARDPPPASAPTWAAAARLVPARFPAGRSRSPGRAEAACPRRRPAPGEVAPPPPRRRPGPARRRRRKYHAVASAGLLKRAVFSSASAASRSSRGRTSGPPARGAPWPGPGRLVPT